MTIQTRLPELLTICATIAGIILPSCHSCWHNPTLAGKTERAAALSNRPIHQSGYWDGKRGRTVGERAQVAYALPRSRLDPKCPAVDSHLLPGTIPSGHF